MQLTVVLDEFYSRYVYAIPLPGPRDGTSRQGQCGDHRHAGDPLPAHGQGASAAHYVEDVDRDPVVIVDGPTKG